MTKEQRLNEIEARRKREQDLVLQEQAFENQRHHRMTVEKNNEFQSEIKRMVQNKETYNKLNEEINKLKQDKKRLKEETLSKEKVYISEHVKNIDTLLEQKIRKKQEELDNWSNKMELFVQASP